MKYMSSFELFTNYSDEKSNELKLIKKYLGSKKKKRLLDVGAGNAYLTRGLVSLFDEVVVIEKNIDFKNNYNKKIKLNLCSIEKFSTKDKFDVIIASHVFPYIIIERRQEILQKLINYLNKNGILLILEMTRHGQLENLKRKIYAEDFKSTYEILSEIFSEKEIKTKEISFKNKIIVNKFEYMLDIIEFFSEKYNGEFLKKKAIIEDYITAKFFNKTKNKYILDYYNKLIIIKK